MKLHLDLMVTLDSCINRLIPWLSNNYSRLSENRVMLITCVHMCSRLMTLKYREAF